MRQLIRFFFLLAAAAGLASAQCYSFTAPGVSYTMNISALTTVQNSSTLSNWIVQQQSTLTVGGTIFTGPPAVPGNISIDDVGGETIFQSAAAQLLTIPTWQVNINLIGMIDYLPKSPTASLPPLGSWQVQPPQLEYSIGSGAAIKLTITGIGTCSTGGGTSGVPGSTLGDPSAQQWCPVCGIVPDPIQLGTGNMFEREIDYRTVGSNPLAFIRYYNSLTAGATTAKSLGSNWRSNYDRYLDLSSSSVIAERPDGQQVTFTLTAGAWTTDTDIDITLVNSGSTWILTDHGDVVETYKGVSASEALLQTIQARNGYTQTLLYNANNQVTSVTDSFNRQLSFAYSNSLLQSVTTPDGLVVTYGLTPSGASSLLTSVTYSTTPATTKKYVYENSLLPAALTGIVDENGSRYMTWTYDSTGRALTSQSGAGADLTTIVYNDGDGSRTVTNPLGEQVLYKFSTLQGVPKAVEADRIAAAGITAATSTFTYDSNGYMASETDWNGNKTTFINDSRGEPIVINEAVGTALARSTAITYHPTFRLPVKIVTPGATVNFAYDSVGELLTATTIDTTTTTAPYATGGQIRTSTLTWADFLPASVQGPRSDVAQLTKFTYDASGALTSITNALNQKVQITQHLPGGLPQTVVDANGVTTAYTYDARQRPVSVARQTSAGTLTNTFAYDAAGNLVSTTWPDASSFKNKFDAAHRLTGFTDSLGNSLAFTLDALGDRTQVAAADVSGNTQFKRSGGFDALGRMLKMIGAANQTTTLAYDPDGNAVTLTDPLNHVVQQSFDALNRKIKVTNPANGVSTIVYDAHNRPVGITDPNGATTTYTYDGFGDMIQQASPASGTTIFRTDAAGNVVQRVDARGVVMNRAYDALNRVIAVTFPGNPAENITHTYDEPGHGFGTGRLTSMSDPSGTISRSYDERGNLLSETRTRGSVTLVTSYTYDTASRLASITYPSRWTVAYARDAAGRVSAVTSQSPSGASQPIVSAISYAPFGPVNELTYGNGIADRRSLDLDYRVSSMNSGKAQNLSYTYDAANNVLSITDGLNVSNSQSLGYDVLNRLTSASGPYGKLSYTYDANGNRTSEQSQATADGLNSVTTLTYDQTGRLQGVSNGSQQLTQYTYDGFGHRAVKTGSLTGATFYDYGAGSNLLEETDGQGHTQIDYVYLGPRPIATIEADGSIYFLHDDHLGTPQSATGSSQAVAWSTTYEPFGKIATPPSQIVENLRLPGQEADLETGMNHNGFRDYAPGLGAYEKSDPIGLAGGLNTYAYAGGNPLRFTDRLGLDCPFADRWNLGIYNLEVAVDNGVVDTLSSINSSVANLQYNVDNATVDALSLWNLSVASSESYAADSVANLAQTYAEGSSEFGDIGIVYAYNMFGTPLDDIVLGADVIWSLLARAAESAEAGAGGKAALEAQSAIIALIGLAGDVGEAAPGQKGTAFAISGTAAAAGFAASVSRGGFLGALWGNTVTPAVKTFLQLYYHESY